jgi:O-antigen biosynthesis alpha-1,3-rhamnosyltransferase
LGCDIVCGIIPDVHAFCGKDNIMTSVIIPTRDAAGQIRGLVEALKSQTIPCEVIVVDSSSPDNTAGIARSLGAEVVVIKRTDFDHGGTRTLAARKAKGDILVCMTQDAMPSDAHAIEKLLAPFRDRDVAAAYGRQLPFPGASPFGAHLRLFNYPEISCVRSIEDKETLGIRTIFMSNSFAAYRKSALRESGWFREGLIMGEDTCAAAELLLAGYKIAYVAEAVVYHSHNYTPLEEFRRYFDIGVFHETEHWIQERFGKAEGEGRRYVVSELRYLREQKKYRLLPEFIARNCMKYAGYRLGKTYKRIPRGLVRKISMHGDWWRSGKSR